MNTETINKEDLLFYISKETVQHEANAENWQAFDRGRIGHR